jgi:hypothetical protein
MAINAQDEFVKFFTKSSFARYYELSADFNSRRRDRSTTSKTASMAVLGPRQPAQTPKVTPYPPFHSF